jgi:hypothetical protein
MDATSNRKYMFHLVRKFHSISNHYQARSDSPISIDGAGCAWQILTSPGLVFA